MLTTLGSVAWGEEPKVLPQRDSVALLITPAPVTQRGPAPEAHSLCRRNRAPEGPGHGRLGSHRGSSCPHTVSPYQQRMVWPIVDM